MIDARQLRADIHALLTSAPIHCSHEAQCFRVALALQALLPEPVGSDSAPDVDQDEVADYAPDWSAS